MKKIGIVGGIGWPSTIEYYRLICEASQSYHSGKEFTGAIPMPEIAIESLNMNYTMNNRGTTESGSWEKWDSYFKSALKNLERSGSELALLASVTPHGRFKEITADLSIPVLSVYNPIGEFCQVNEIQNLLVLGTLPTMTSPAFKLGMSEFGVNALYPPTDELKAGVVSIIGQLYKGQTVGAGEAIEALVHKSVPDADGRIVVCLACTELPLAFEKYSNQASFEVNGITYINSSVLHAQAAFKACVSEPD